MRREKNMLLDNKYKKIILLNMIFIFISFLFYCSLPTITLARNYNYDILNKSQKPLNFNKGNFTVKRDGQEKEVSTLEEGDKIKDFSNSNAYDNKYHPGECKQFVNIILYEVADNKDLPDNSCINSKCGGYYSNFSKNIKDVVPGDILHCRIKGNIWHTMVALKKPEYDKDDNPSKIYVLDSNKKDRHIVRKHYHDLKNHNTYAFSKGWEYTLSYEDQNNDKCSENPMTLAPGETVTIEVRLKNLGREPWSNDPTNASNIYLATTPKDINPNEPPPIRHSEFASEWIDSEWKICYPEEESIHTGETATFRFQMEAPSVEGEYTEYFYPYHVSGGWIPNQETKFPEMHVTINVQSGDNIEIGEDASSEEIRLAFVNAHTPELGDATSTVKPAKSHYGTNGSYQTFNYGSIQYIKDGENAGQAFVLYGRLYEKWENLGYADSVLGFPVSNRIETTSSFDTSGIYQLFEGGSLQLNGIDPYAVYGDVYSTWEEIDFADGELGFPTSDRNSTKSGFGTSGYYQCFEGGSIQGVDSETYVVEGDIYNTWGEVGYATWAGFPISNAYDWKDGQRQNFEGGYIYSDDSGSEFVSTTHPQNLSADPQSSSNTMQLAQNVDNTYTTQERESVQLTWDNNVQAQGIKIYRSHNSSREVVANLDPDLSSYQDDTVVEGNTYTYFAKAYHNTDTSPASNKVSVEVQDNGTDNDDPNAGLADSPWPCFGGDVRNTGQSEYEGNEYSNQKFEFDIGGDLTSPVIDGDGTIYVGSSNKLYAFYPNGTQNWSFETMDQGGYVTPAISPPIIGSNGTIYFLSNYNYLYAINKKGDQKWKFNIPNSASASPVISNDGTIYVVSSDKQLYAINKNCSLKWTFEIGNAASSSPVIGSNGTIYVGSKDRNLYAIKPDGTLKWYFETGYSITTSPAIGNDGIIYVLSGDNKLYAIRQNGSQKWTFDIGSAYTASPVIGGDGTVYINSGNGKLYAINSDGSLKWTFNIDGYGSTTPSIGRNGTIYVGTNSNKLYVIKPDGTRKWGFTISSSKPAVCNDGTIYLGTNKLYALRIPEEKGKIYGVVEDMYTNDAIISSTVTTSKKNTQTNTKGKYSLILSPGIYDCTFSKTGYATKTIKDVVIEKGKEKKLNAVLTTPGPLNIKTNSLSSAETKQKYNQRINISGGAYGYSFTVASGTIPPGLSLDSQSGNIVGTPTKPGSYTFSIGVEDAEGTYAEREYNIEVTEELHIVTQSEDLPRGTQGQDFFQSIEAAGGKEPYSFAKTSGSLPDGMSIDSDGSLTGSPQETGSFDYSVQVSDDSGRSAERSFHLEIVPALNIGTSQLKDAIVGDAYNQSLSASGGYGDYQWQVYSGTLPDGLNLDSNSGVLSGTPTEETYGSIVLAVVDQEGRIDYQDFTLQVVEPLQIATESLPDGLKDHSYSEAVRTQGGTGPYSFSYQGQLSMYYPWMRRQELFLALPHRQGW